MLPPEDGPTSLRCVRCTHEIVTGDSEPPERCAWCGLPVQFSLTRTTTRGPGPDTGDAGDAGGDATATHALPALTPEEWDALQDVARRYQQTPTTLAPAERALLRVLHWAYETGRLAA